jgi:hypothetical protein
MSQHELIDAYVSGAINRRTFVRGLTALGVSATLAASYAVALEPPAAAKGHDFYDFYNTPNSKDDCKKGGYKKFGFKNQGQCIAAVNQRAHEDAGKGKAKGRR